MIDWLWEERNAVTIRKRVLGEKKRRKEEKKKEEKKKRRKDGDFDFRF